MYRVDEMSGIGAIGLHAMRQLAVELDSSNQVVITLGYAERVVSSGKLFFAWDGDVIVGMATLVVGIVPTNPRSWLENVAVLPAHRRQGVATMLIQRALDEAPQCGIKTVQLCSGHTNPGNPLLDKLGFELVGAATGPNGINLYHRYL